VRAFLADLLERTIATYLQAFFGLLLAGETLDLSVDAVQAAAIAALPAALAVLKAAAKPAADLVLAWLRERRNG
jgi:predicted NBD/HSP70 family sugar kinase